MTDQEILTEYKNTIDAHIEQYCKQRPGLTLLNKEEFSKGFKIGFVEGFHKGYKQALNKL